MKKVTSEWAVKDVVAHMVGWEKGDLMLLEKRGKPKRSSSGCLKIVKGVITSIT